MDIPKEGHKDIKHLEQYLAPQVGRHPDVEKLLERLNELRNLREDLTCTHSHRMLKEATKHLNVPFGWHGVGGLIEFLINDYKEKQELLREILVWEDSNNFSRLKKKIQDSLKDSNK